MGPATPTSARVAEALQWLERHESARNRAGMARYAIVSQRILGVSVAEVRRLARRLGRDHRLAEALWRTGVHEARMLAAFVDEPARVTRSQMDRWVRGFDNWAICDAHCMHLFDRTPHAWAMARAWTRRQEEFVKRAGFALYASLATHDDNAPDERFLPALRAIERESGDDRHLVRKASSWALRSIGRRSPGLRREALRCARRLAASGERSARWIGRDAMREFARRAPTRGGG